MIKFYAPTFSSTRDDAYARIVKRTVGSFDVLAFMRGRPFDGTIPSDVKVLLGDGELADFMSTHVSWRIFSRRAADHRASWRRCRTVFEAPLFRERTGEQIEGYKILNATRSVRCIDL